MSDGEDGFDGRENILLQEDGTLAGKDANGATADPCGYYASLGVPQNSSQQAIRQAFLQLSQIFHTDKHAGEDEEVQALMNERFQQLMEAYSILSDERKRAAYDASGKLGLNRYSLIPKEVTQRDEILRFMTTLEREAELLKLSRLLSTSSKTVITYSVEHLTNFPGALGSPMGGDAFHPEREEEVKEGVRGPGPSSGLPDETQGSNTEPVSLNTSVAVQEVQLGGKNVLVLIPGDDVQRQLRQKLESSMGGERLPSTKSGSGLVEVPLTTRLLLGFVPRKFYFEHSIHQYVSTSFSLRSRTEVRQEGMQSVVRCTAIATYQPNPVSFYSLSWRVSVSRLHIACTWERILNNLWKLKSKLVLFNGRTLLPTYELSFKRMLAAGCEVESTWVMSLRNSGFFRTTIGQSTPEGAQRGLQLLVGYRTANISLFSTAPTVWSKDEAGCGGAAGGVLEHSVSVDALRARAHIGFSSWYTVSKYNRIGVAFSTVLPCSWGVPGYISSFVDCPSYLSVNEVALLFGRGDNEVRIPIIVFRSPKVQYALLWLTGPVLLYRIGCLVMRPYQAVRTAAAYRRYRLDHRAEMDVARVRATREQKCLQSSALRSRVAEEEIGGLVIINARYGVLQPRYPESLVLNRRQTDQPGAKYRGNSATSGEQRRWWWRFWCREDGLSTPSGAQHLNGGASAGDENGGDDTSVLVLDVTVPLQNFVRDSQLILPEGSKSKLVGFTDPDPFTQEKKQLKVVYRFQRKRHVVILNDEDGVRLPQREHLVEP